MQETCRFDRKVPATWVAQRINDEPVPDPSTVFVPGVENDIEPKLSNSNNLPRNKNGVTATTDSTAQKKQALRYTTQQRLNAAMVEQAEYASPTGEAIGSMKAGNLGEIGLCRLTRAPTTMR